MSDFMSYLRLEKVKWIHKIQNDFKKDFGFELPHGAGFTRSDFVHFVAVDGKKYVHKGAMTFILTNGGTYFLEQKKLDSFKVNENAEERKKIDLKVERMFDFFRKDINQCKLYPTLLSESENFFIFKYYDENEWTKLDHLTKQDSEYIRSVYVDNFRGTNEVVTPFYSQMLYKLFRNNKTGEVVAVDLKSLEFRPKISLGIFMCGWGINDFYLLERRYWTKNYILKPYSVDYPVRETNLIKLY